MHTSSSAYVTLRKRVATAYKLYVSRCWANENTVFLCSFAYNNRSRRYKNEIEKCVRIYYYNDL